MYDLAGVLKVDIIALVQVPLRYPGCSLSMPYHHLVGCPLLNGQAKVDQPCVQYSVSGVIWECVPLLSRWSIIQRNFLW